jgi:hypothetical protein
MAASVWCVCRVDSLASRVDDVVQREDSMRLVLQRIDMRLADLEDWISMHTPSTAGVQEKVTGSKERIAATTGSSTHRLYSPRESHPSDEHRMARASSEQPSSRTSVSMASGSVPHLNVNSQLFLRRRKRNDSGHSLKTATTRGMALLNSQAAKSSSMENVASSSLFNVPRSSGTFSSARTRDSSDLWSGRQAAKSAASNNRLRLAREGSVTNEHNSLADEALESPELEVVSLLKPDIIPEENFVQLNSSDREYGRVYKQQGAAETEPKAAAEVSLLPGLSVQVPQSPHVHFPSVDSSLLLYDADSTSLSPGGLPPLHRHQLLLQTIDDSKRRSVYQCFTLDVDIEFVCLFWHNSPPLTFDVTK